MAQKRTKNCHILTCFPKNIGVVISSRARSCFSQLRINICVDWRHSGHLIRPPTRNMFLVHHLGPVKKKPAGHRAVPGTRTSPPLLRESASELVTPRQAVWGGTQNGRIAPARPAHLVLPPPSSVPLGTHAAVAALPSQLALQFACCACAVPVEVADAPLCFGRPGDQPVESTNSGSCHISWIHKI